ncbi:MAG: hypothetical protein LBR36_08545 [Bacteroidales bacterium]|jgi:hypothetical protein|nr:hypothetical protein [Bacteroidales bacterium]
MLETPILFLIFNREDTTKRVFEAICQQKPKFLFIAADGPRKNKEGEAEKCQKVRDIVSHIDWDCELKTLFREENLGCKMAVSGAISWFFEQVEQGIILEDDCLPDPSFFPYCETLLNYYKNDQRIGCISGNCFFPELIDKNYSYAFSQMPHIWGWATWARVWKNYDADLSYWQQYQDDTKQREALFLSKREKIYFDSFIADVLSGRNNTWDTQFMFMLRAQNQISICPSVNLVTNIGLTSADATHAFSKINKLLKPSVAISFPLKHPKYVVPNKELGKTTVRENFFSWKRLLRYYLKKVKLYL